MSSQLVCPDGSLERLAAEGINFGIVDNKIIVAVPYLDAAGELKRGYLGDPLNLPDGSTIGVPENHQMYFAGGEPHQINGASLLPIIGQAEAAYPLFGDIVSRYHLSHKLKDSSGAFREYVSLFEKVRQYVRVIGGPAMAKYRNCELYVGDVNFGVDRESPFVFPDAHSAAAGLEQLNDSLRSLSIGIVGLGGTGGYILDFIAKTPVKNIKLIDGDKYLVKNSFRSPGTSVSQDFMRPKVQLYADRYRTFRSGIEPIAEHLTDENAHIIDDCNFVFVSVDKGSSRREISAILDARLKSYIDVGLGLERTDDGLIGMIRTTFVDDNTRDRVLGEKALPMLTPEQEEYVSNIQIGELNALNAALAVMRFKSHFGFYRDTDPYYNALLGTRRLNMSKRSINA